MTELPVRKKHRLEWHNYSRDGAYFITICVKGRHNVLGRIVGAAHPGGPSTAHPGGPSVELSETGSVVKQHIDTISAVYPYVCVDKYVIMPNHIHMILLISCGPPGCAAPTKSTVAKAVNALKSLTSRWFGEPMWQRSYHDRIIRNEDEYLRIWQYIDNNPIEWQDDEYCVM